jgi:hypothetical protein
MRRVTQWAIVVLAVALGAYWGMHGTTSRESAAAMPGQRSGEVAVRRRLPAIAGSPEPSPEAAPRTAQTEERVPAVTGHAVDDAGNPVEGAEVYAMDPAMETAGRNVPTASTDGRGVWTLTGPIPAGYQVVATKRGFVAGSADVQSAGDLTIRLERGASISGRVFDFEGHGVAGAQVIALGPYSAFSFVDPARRIGPRGVKASSGLARTDGDGRYTITGLRRGAVHRVDAERQGYYASYERNPAGGVTATPDAVDVDFLMESARTFELHFLDARDRTPIPGFELDCLGTNVNSLGAELVGEHFAADRDEAALQQRGAARLSARIPASAKSLPSHVLQVYVSALGYETAKVRLDLDQAGAPDGPIEVLLHPVGAGFGNLRLHFADPSGTVPLQAIRTMSLHLEANGNSFDRLAAPMSSGTVELDRLPTGRVRVSMLGRGRSPTSMGYTFDDLDVEVRTGATTDVDVALRQNPESACLAVTTRDAQSRGIENVDVEVRESPKHSVSGRSGAEGVGCTQYFYVAPGRVSLIARKRGYADTRSEFELEAGKVNEVDVVLRDASEIK